MQVIQSRDRFTRATVLDEDLAEAVDWISGHSSAEVRTARNHHLRHDTSMGPCIKVNAYRELCIETIEEEAREHVVSGRTKAWLEKAEPGVAQACTTTSSLHHV